MVQWRIRYCSPYQQKREVKGQPQCPHTRKACPYGLHACEVCGKAGHGAEDCWSSAKRKEVEARLKAPANPEPEPATVTNAPEPATVPMPAKVMQQDQAQFVPGFGKKEKERERIMGLPSHLHAPFRVPKSHCFTPAVLPMRL